MSDKNRIWDEKYPDLYKRESGNYYLRYWSPKLKRTLEESLRTNEYWRAEKARKKILENLQDQKTNEAKGYKTWRSVAEAFKSETVWDSEGTRKSAMNQINKHLGPWFGMYNPDKIDDNLWKKYANERRDEVPGCSLLNARKYLWKVQNWAFDKGIVKKKFIPTDFEAGRKSPGVIVTRAQLDKIQKYLPLDYKDLSEIAFEMAFRIGELKNLEWDRVNFKTDEIILEAKHTKTRRGRKPVMTAKVKEILSRRLKDSKGPYVFPMPTDSNRPLHNKDAPWQLAKKSAGIKCRFHDLRHTWLTSAFKASNRYAEICEYAGLSLDEALDTYVKFNTDDMRAIAVSVGTFENSLGKNWENLGHAE